MNFARIAFIAGALLTWASTACAAEERMLPCKNHYILDDPCPPEVTGATVRIAKLFSTLDATVQAVEVSVVGGGTQSLGGRRMTVRDRHGETRSFVIGWPFYYDEHVSSLLLMGSAWMEGVDDGFTGVADLDMPDYFLPVDGGVLSIDGIDEITFGPLPVDGSHALARDGSTVPADFGIWGSFDIPTTVVREFYHAGLDHYFMTNRADEIEALLTGAIPGWQPTGKALYAVMSPLSDAYRPVCRYLLERPGDYSHFFRAWDDECDALADEPGDALETRTAFYVALPSDGVCATRGPIPGNGYGVIGGPVYRLWNGLPETNHRFVTERSERDAMVARGWIPEGQGIDDIAMCAWSVDLPLPR